MTNEKVMAIIQMYKNLVPSESLLVLKNKLEETDDSKYDNLLRVKPVNLGLILGLSIFFGRLGIDRFVLRDSVIGACKLIVFSLVPILLSGVLLLCNVDVVYGLVVVLNLVGLVFHLVDIPFCYKKAKQKNLQTLLNICDDVIYC